MSVPKLSDFTSGKDIRLSEPAIAPGLPALFVADLHLTDKRPEIVDAFLDFLSGPASQAASLFILGDLFEYWAGDDDADSAFNQRICTALRKTAATTPVFFMVGNRDLLAGEGFARAAGVQLLADPTVIRFASCPLLLSHGDILCTDDHAYQAFRRQVRDRDWQADFLGQSLAARRTFIENAREQSETAKRGKRMEIMDVNVEAVANLLRSHACSTLIHGHTHRPGHHIYLIDGHNCERYVLADWRERAVWLAYDGAMFSAHSGTD